MISFTVPGQPQGKARPRVVSRGGYAHAYTPAKTASYEALVRQTYKLSFPGQKPLTGPIECEIEAFYEVPRSWPLKKRQEALAGLILPEVKPDLDNVAKIVCDALNGTAWEDDKQITLLKVRKQYGTPRVEVTIWQK